jgi:uncharacterized protein YqiB (DUF1249 family)
MSYSRINLKDCLKIINGIKYERKLYEVDISWYENLMRGNFERLLALLSHQSKYTRCENLMILAENETLKQVVKIKKYF